MFFFIGISFYSGTELASCNQTTDGGDGHYGLYNLELIPTMKMVHVKRDTGRESFCLRENMEGWVSKTQVLHSYTIPSSHYGLF